MNINERRRLFSATNTHLSLALANEFIAVLE